MPVTFDGANLLIELPSGVTTLDAQEDFYEPWKVYAKTSDANGFRALGYPEAFRSIAGDPLTPAINYSGVIFMQNQNGWRFRLPDENISVTLTGNLALEDPDIDGITARAGRTGLLFGLAEFVTNSQVITDQLTDIEGGFGHAELMRGMFAAMAGLLSGAPAGPIIIKGINGTKTRLDVTVDANGNRTVINTRDLTP